MKYDQSINGPEAEAWKAEIENEHDRMVKNKVFQEVQRKDLPPGAKPIDSTCGHTRRRVMALTESESKAWDSSRYLANIMTAAAFMHL